MQDITITRQFSVIDGFVVMPDYGPGRIPIDVALSIPGITRNQLTNVTLESASRRGHVFLETVPGYTECCAVVPSDDITEIVKTRTPEYPPYEPPYDPGYTPEYDPDNPPPQPEPCPEPTCPPGNLTAVWDMPFFDPGPCNCAGGTGGTTIVTMSLTGDCTYFGTTNNDLRVTVYWDAQLCTWVMIIQCMVNRIWTTIWTGWSSTGPTGTYNRYGLDCADLAYLTYIVVS